MRNLTAINALYILLFTVAWVIVEYILVSDLAFAYVALFIGGFVLWWFTTRKTPINPNAVIIPYLLTVVSFITAVSEEYQAELAGFPTILHGLPLTYTIEQMIIYTATLAPVLWLLGAIFMLKRWSVGYYIASTFLFGMMFIEPYHFIAPFTQGGAPHYVEGLYTAIFPVALAWYTFFAIRREIRKTKEKGELQKV